MSKIFSNKFIKQEIFSYLDTYELIRLSSINKSVFKYMKEKIPNYYINKVTSIDFSFLNSLERKYIMRFFT